MALEQQQESLRALKCKRGIVKATLTRFHTYLDALTQETIVDIIPIKVRLSKIEDCWSQFFALHTEICILNDDVDNTTEADAFQDSYFDAISKAERIISKDASNHSQTNVSSTAAPSQANDVQSQVRLPQITLPCFSGAFEEWIPFYEMFDSLIHSNESLSKVQRFHYLKSCLKGEASNCVQELQISANNYDIAWATLKDRFDNKRIIIKKHIQAINDLPNCIQESAGALRNIYDTVQKHTRALKALNRPVEQWDDWLVYVITNKLDRITTKEWEANTKTNHIPSFQELLEFLAHKCTTLEAMTKTVLNTSTKINKHQRSAFSHISQHATCAACRGEHFLYQCRNFLKMLPQDRLKRVTALKLCLNCLRPGHKVSKCNSSCCRKCNRKHNTLLHLENNNFSEPEVNSNDNNSKEQLETVSAHTTYVNNYTRVILSTAIIQIRDNNGVFHQCRAFLDSGSQSNFITNALVKKLNLKQQKVNIPVSGIAQVSTRINKSINARIKSNYNHFYADITCLILDNITSDTPSTNINKRRLNIPKGLMLADPEFNRSRQVDLLIGAELFWHLLCVGQIKLADSGAIMQKTQLGWIVSGTLQDCFANTNNTVCNLSLEQALDLQLSKFWETEECSKPHNYCAEELSCENHFANNFRRNDQGRFIVKLPTKQDASTLGNSKDMAIKRFYSLERKLESRPQLKEQYVEFMKEYIQLDHMKLVQEDLVESSETNTFYLPHHAVIKNDSLTTKLRVVFDASAKSTSGYSLNDILMVGPTIQADYLADNLQTYELKTVTYGTASVSFLATRVLKQLALEECSKFPIGARIVQRDFYVDDLLTGSDDIENIKTIFMQVKTLLESGGFHLRKWASNNFDILKQLLPDATEPTVLNLNKDATIKTLGLQWNSKFDVLQYIILEAHIEEPSTKRIILKKVAQIFDPLGLLGPVIIKAKILIQTLWQLKISWDESLPLLIYTEWCQYYRSLSKLNSLRIPRNVIPYKCDIELHGFCDASEKAYGACIYIRGMNQNGQFACELVCAKSRVAPLKVTTIPRLELCAALLLARLTDKVIQSVELSFRQLYYWTDSTIVLAWINTTARQLKTYVSNRVAEIQEITDAKDWNHVSTNENPADALSRGLSSEDMLQTKLWWHGPTWLTVSDKNWPRSKVNIGDLEIEEKRNITIANVTTLKLGLFERYSNFIKLQRVVSYCRRFSHNLLCRLNKRPAAPFNGPLTTSELNAAIKFLIGLVQAEAFSEELCHLKNGKNVQPTSKLITLHPFIDSDNLIRVGGRLQNSQCQYDKKHPIVLPSKHTFTRLLIEHVHHSEFHAGAQATLAKIRDKFWPLCGRNTVRCVIRNCIQCFRSKPIAYQPITGNLPTSRVEPARPFINTGVDYCGPFLLSSSTRRKSVLTKAYIAVFVCMAVKAVHVELVTSLNTDAFINALKRFIARRGMVKNIYSDNGANFVKANKELKELHKMFTVENDKIASTLSTQGISWHFIPPRAPHFGGIWEAAVKAFKYNFKRIVSNAKLTFDEFTTISTQIEAILNSRPLIPLSEDPNDMSALTPGHFLIGDSLRCNLEPSLLHLKVNHLSRLQLIEQLKQHFLQKWSKIYLQQLQVRQKWTRQIDASPQVGQLVILKDENTPPMLWSLGRIVAVHPGTDGVVRAATVKTIHGEKRRAANRLCVLPVGDVP